MSKYRKRNKISSSLVYVLHKTFGHFHELVVQKLPRNSQISVMSDETVDQFVLKPRQRAVSCDFGVLEDDYIRDQVIDKCYSSHLRAKVLFLLVCLLFFFTSRCRRVIGSQSPYCLPILVLLSAGTFQFAPRKFCF